MEQADLDFNISKKCLGDNKRSTTCWWQITAVLCDLKLIKLNEDITAIGPGALQSQEGV